MADQKEVKIIRSTKNGRWNQIQKGDLYFFTFQGTKNLVLTPAENPLVTSDPVLAERLLNDLSTYGSDYFTAESVVPYHDTYIDHFGKMSNEQVDQILEKSFLQRTDWTFCWDSDYFGSKEQRLPEIRSWISGCNRMQKTAACGIGNTYHSLNIAYILSKIISENPQSDWDHKFQFLEEMITDYTDYGYDYDNRKVFRTFAFYYGIPEESC